MGVAVGAGCANKTRHRQRRRKAENAHGLHEFGFRLHAHCYGQMKNLARPEVTQADAAASVSGTMRLCKSRK